MSSIPLNVLTNTPYKRKEQVNWRQRKNVTFEDQDQRGEEVGQNLGQESLSGEKDVEGNRRVYQQDPLQESLYRESREEESVQSEEQDLEDKSLPGEFRWMRRAHKIDLEEEICSATDSSVDEDSRNSRN